MKNVETLILLVGLFMLVGQVNIWGQEKAQGCDGPRYEDEVAEAVTITTVKYDEAMNYDGSIIELEMDIFQVENDTFSRRPVVILAHSVVDDRTEMYHLCEQFSRRGYVAASMDYRGGDGVRTYEKYVHVGIRQIQDMKAAVRFFRNDYMADNLFRVDTNYIFVGGFSIGGVMSLHTGYWDDGDNVDPIIDSLLNIEGGIEGNSNEFLNVSSRVQGVINLSGAILHKEWIDQGEAAVVSYHGTADDVVSIRRHLFDGLYFTDGTEEVHQQAAIKNIPNYFHPVSGGGHFDIYEESFSDQFHAFKEATFKFFKESVLCKSPINSISPANFIEQKARIFPNPASRILHIQHDEYEILELIIFDCLGKEIGHWKVNNIEKTIEINKLNSGLYYYTLKNEVHYIQSGKIVINNR